MAPAKRPAPRDRTISVRFVRLVLDRRLFVNEARALVENQFRRVLLLEIEHVVDRTGRGIEGAAAETLAVQPVILDELGDRGLRDLHVADIVLLGVGRDHQEGLASTRTATAR